MMSTVLPHLRSLTLPCPAPLARIASAHRYAYVHRFIFFLEPSSVFLFCSAFFSCVGVWVFLIMITYRPPPTVQSMCQRARSRGERMALNTCRCVFVVSCVVTDDCFLTKRENLNQSTRPFFLPPLPSPSLYPPAHLSTRVDDVAKEESPAKGEWIGRSNIHQRKRAVTPVPRPYFLMLSLCPLPFSSLSFYLSCVRLCTFLFTSPSRRLMLAR